MNHKLMHTQNYKKIYMNLAKDEPRWDYHHSRKN